MNDATRPHTAPSSRSSRRFVGLGVLTLCAAAAMVAAGPMSIFSTSTASAPDATSEELTSRFITPGTASAHLIGAGLTPEVLAASGVRAGDAAVVLLAGHEYVLQHQTELAAADRAVGEARASISELLRSRQARGQGEPVGNEAQAQAQLAAAVAARVEARHTLLAHACDQLPVATRQQINTLITNSGREGVPVKFRSVERAESEWLSLREDLTHLRQATKSGADPDPEVLARVRSAEAHPLVVAANQNLDANLSAVELAFRNVRASR